MAKGIECYRIGGTEGMQVEILNLGATIRSIEVPNKNRLINVVLGYEDINQYREDPFYIGATVGRYANRIANGQFKIGSKCFNLPKNNGANHLHGGPLGFAKRLWTLVEHTENSLILSLLSEEGDQGYPGNLSVEAKFKLEAGMKLSIEYRATSDRATPVNLSSHAYFNFNGFNFQQAQSSNIENHQIQLNAHSYTPVNESMIPTGEIRPVLNTDFDFQQMKSLGAQLSGQDQQIALANGFDHNFIIDGKQDELRFFGEVRSPETDLLMKVYSNQPGVQFYTGNFLNAPFQARQGLCLETQNFPDAPNNKQFPNSIIEPGAAYLSRSEFEFGSLA